MHRAFVLFFSVVAVMSVSAQYMGVGDFSYIKARGDVNSYWHVTQTGSPLTSVQKDHSTDFQELRTYYGASGPMFFSSLEFQAPHVWSNWQYTTGGLTCNFNLLSQSTFAYAAPVQHTPRPSAPITYQYQREGYVNSQCGNPPSVGLPPNATGKPAFYPGNENWPSQSGTRVSVSGEEDYYSDFWGEQNINPFWATQNTTIGDGWDKFFYYGQGSNFGACGGPLLDPWSDPNNPYYCNRGSCLDESGYCNRYCYFSAPSPYYASETLQAQSADYKKPLNCGTSQKQFYFSSNKACSILDNWPQPLATSFSGSFEWATAGGCDDGNPCTFDYCDVEAGGCAHVQMRENCEVHAACVNSVCQSVPGPGPDQCQSSADCSSHTECRGNTCAIVPGPGISMCKFDSDCTDSHYICWNDACMSVPGKGTNECDPLIGCREQHLECRCNTCAIVDGPGANQCTTPADCTKTTHLECVNGSCQEVNGAGANSCTTPGAACGGRLVCQNNACVWSNSPGVSECRTSLDCDATGSHLTCQNNACVRVNGAGLDACNSFWDCQETSHLACKNAACSRVEGPGRDLCNDDFDCQPKYLACENNACVLKDGSQIDQCRTNADCTKTTHLECDSLGYGCYPVNGPGMDRCYGNALNSTCSNSTHLECMNNACQSASGPGLNTCASDADCRPFHSECDFVNGQCLVKPGRGADECSDDAQCAFHSECDYSTGACKAVAGTGKNACNADAQCVSSLIGKHLECHSFACVAVNDVQGQSNRHECNVPGNDPVCANDGFHLECRGRACVKVAGEGTNNCLNDWSCNTGNLGEQTHLECVNNACTEVSGAGPHLCSTAPDACSCNSTLLAGTRFKCVGSGNTGTCTEVVGSGNDECEIEGGACTIPRHLACSGDACVLVDGAGADACSPDNPSNDCRHLACSLGACTVQAGEGADSCTVAAGNCPPPTTQLRCVNNMCEHVECSNPPCLNECQTMGNACGTALPAAIQIESIRAALNPLPRETPLEQIRIAVLNVSQPCPTGGIRLDFLNPQNGEPAGMASVGQLGINLPQGRSHVDFVRTDSPPNGYFDNSEHLPNGLWTIRAQLYCDNRLQDVQEEFLIVQGTRPVNVPEVHPLFAVVLALAALVLLYNGAGQIHFKRKNPE